MNKLIWISLIFLVGCCNAKSSIGKPEDEDIGLLNRYVDPEYRVVCYRKHNSERISCVHY